jgi:hypothetical protein
MNLSVKVTANRSPFFNLKNQWTRNIFLRFYANAASTPSFPKVSDSEPLITPPIVRLLMVISFFISHYGSVENQTHSNSKHPVDIQILVAYLFCLSILASYKLVRPYVPNVKSISNTFTISNTFRSPIFFLIIVPKLSPFL